MWWLLGEILLCLLIAFILGAIIGCLICRLFGGEDNTHEAELEACRKKRTELEAALAACKKRSDKLEAELKAANEKLDGLNSAIDSTAAAFAYAAGTSSAAGEPPVVAAAAAPLPSASTKDDLKKIWGIGRKIEELLNENGIFTFAQVAATAEERFRDILLASGNKQLHQIANEETWAEQAEMAARGAWNELKAYQEKLDWSEGGQPT